MSTAIAAMNINDGSSQLTGIYGLKIEFSNTSPPQKVTMRVYLLMLFPTKADVGGVGDQNSVSN